MNKKTIALLLFFLSAFGFYAFCGFFVIQPIGAVPEGATVLYLRAGTNMPFICSVDGFLLEQTGEVSLFARAMTFGVLGKLVVERKIVKLPYSEQLYLVSTGGKTPKE